MYSNCGEKIVWVAVMLGTRDASSVDHTEWDSVSSGLAKLSYVPWVDAFNKGKFVTCFQSHTVLAVLLGLFFPTPKLKVRMKQFESGLSKS